MKNDENITRDQYYENITRSQYYSRQHAMTTLSLNACWNHVARVI